MRFIKYIFILSFFLPAVVFSGGSVDVCSVSFSKHEEFIKSFFSDSNNINQYQGPTGYIRFVEEHLSFLQMDTVFLYTSRILSKEDMVILNWQAYRGSTKELRQDISQILDEMRNIKTKYQGQVGYILYADEFYLGDMKKAYINISAALSESEKKNLNWKSYRGSTKEFRKERLQILDEIGKVKKEYQGKEGYARYSDEFYLGDMTKAYINVSAVLSESEKKNLNWQVYQGSTKEFRKERSQILDETGKVKKEYQGLKGYARYADEFSSGKMKKAHINVSVVLFGSEKESLNWKQYQGSTKELRQERSRILDKTGNVKKKYQGPTGYIRYSDEFYVGKMQITYRNVSAVLSESEKKSLNWKQYHGSTKEFGKERSQILDEKGNIKKEYQGKEGYVRYSDEFYIGDMKKAYENVSAVLNELEKKNLNWQSYQGSTKEFRKERLQILDETGNVKKKYQGPKGYARYADEFYGGDMIKAYINISAMLFELEKKNLNWQLYQGSTKEFRKERSQILDEKGNIKKEYQGLFGYARYADEFSAGKMAKTYTNVSAVLSESEKKNLNWQSYQGSTKEFREERLQILDDKGNIKKEYQDQEGYARYSDEFYGGERKELGDMKKAYLNVSAVLSESEKKNLNWQSYQGNTKEFRKERSNILDETENVKKEYQGPLGYARYADDFYGGDMKKSYINVSAVLSKKDMKDLGWKVFFGDTHQFRSLFEFFKNHNFEDYQGPLGQKKIANTIFKNHLKNTYANISALRNHLFSHQDEFKDLRESGWSRTLSW